MTEMRGIWCCGCQGNINARLTSGAEIYPHRPDLSDLPFWKCDACKNYVGCHHKTKKPTNPLGNIPTPELRSARQHIHKLLDPMWKDGRFTRPELYDRLSTFLGWKYHTSKIKSIEEARRVYKFLQEINKQPYLNPAHHGAKK